MAFQRFGEKYGQQITTLRDSGKVDGAVIAELEEDIFNKISWGGDNDTDCVISAVQSLGISPERRNQFLARHLAQRAMFRGAFIKTAETDVNQTRAVLGDNFSDLIVQALQQNFDERLADKRTMYRRDQTPSSIFLASFSKVSNNLGLDETNLAKVTDYVSATKIVDSNLQT